MIVFGASGLSISFPWAGRIAYVGSRSIIGALAAGAVALVSVFMNGGAGETVVAATAAALVAEVADAGFASFTYWLRGYGHWIVVARDSLPVIAASVPFYSSAVAILVLSYTEISPWTLPLFFAAGTSRSTVVPALPGAAAPGDGSAGGERPTSRRKPLVREGPNRHSRRPRSVHGRSLGGRRHLRARHRQAHGSRRRSFGSGSPVWPRARHREDWPTSRPTREARCSDS